MTNNEQRDRQIPLVAIVAETDLMTRATLVTLLSCDGYRVFQQDNVKAAIPCIDSTNDLAVLFVDLDMPGWKSLVRHALNMTPRAFIIAMGESDPIPEISDLEQSGIIQACLNKPLMYNDLRRALSDKVERQLAA